MTSENIASCCSVSLNRWTKMSHVMRKPVYAIYEQQRRRSACASAQSDQRLCCSLPRSHDTSSFYTPNFQPLPSFCGCAGWFESTLVANPEDRFSHDEAQIWDFTVLRLWVFPQPFEGVLVLDHWQDCWVSSKRCCYLVYDVMAVTSSSIYRPHRKKLVFVI